MKGFHPCLTLCFTETHETQELMYVTFSSNERACAGDVRGIKNENEMIQFFRRHPILTVHPRIIYVALILTVL